MYLLYRPKISPPILTSGLTLYVSDVNYQTHSGEHDFKLVESNLLFQDFHVIFVLKAS